MIELATQKCRMKHTRWLLVVVALMASGCVDNGVDSAKLQKGELGLLPARPERGGLFDYYEAKGLAKWKSNWTHPLDMTGVSWNDTRAATVIAPHYVVMAAHYVRTSDVPVMFHDRDGNPVERYIVAVKSLAPLADIAVGKLNLAVPGGIKIYRFAAAGELSPGRAVLVTDQTKTVSVHQVATLNGGQMSFSYRQDIDPIYRRILAGGDSGHPSFIISSGDIRLVETHTYGGLGSGPCYADSRIQTAIREAMAGME